MSQKLDAPKLPNGTYPELSPNPNSKGVELKDGGRGTPVVVNTEPRKSNTNTITVDEVKRLIREAIDHFEKEEGGVTEEELQAALSVKADKIGTLPYFEVNPTDNVLDFINNNNVAGKPIVIKIDSLLYIGQFRKRSDTLYDFEFEELCSAARFRGTVTLTNRTFIYLLSPQYEEPYALRKDLDSYTKIHDYAEGTTLTNAIWNSLKTGDILKVNNMQFIINVFETTGEGAYKGVTGTMVGAVTANSITIASIDWRTVGEGYTELEPTLTTLTIGGNE